MGKEQLEVCILLNLSLTLTYQLEKSLKFSESHWTICKNESTDI